MAGRISRVGTSKPSTTSRVAAAKAARAAAVEGVGGVQRTAPVDEVNRAESPSSIAMKSLELDGTKAADLKVQVEANEQALNDLQNVQSQAGEIAEKVAEASPEALNEAAGKVDELLEEGVTIANRKTEEGGFLFGGEQAKSEPFEAKKDADGKITEVNYRPARERELLARAAPLTADEARWVTRLAGDSAQLQSSAFAALPRERQALIQEAAYRLVRYEAAGQQRDSANAARSYQLLQAINRNPPPALQIETPTYPEFGHESRTWQLAAGSREGRAFAEYGLRMAYHDLADNLAGFPLGAQIELGDIKLRQYEGNHWQLEEFGLVNIRSLTPRSALLKPWSWQVEAGWERVAGGGKRTKRSTSGTGLKDFVLTRLRPHEGVGE